MVSSSEPDRCDIVRGKDGMETMPALVQYSTVQYSTVQYCKDRQRWKDKKKDGKQELDP